MIRSRSPPGVCLLTVRADSGILKIFIAFFHPGSGVNVAALHRGKAGVLFSSTFSPSVTRKFQKFFAKFHHFFTDPVTDFWMRKRDIGGYFFAVEIFEKTKKSLHFYAYFLFKLPIKSSSK